LSQFVEGEVRFDSFGIRAAWKRSRPDAEGIEPDFAFDELAQLLDWDLLTAGCQDG
jgi:hypothetical protein